MKLHHQAYLLFLATVLSTGISALPVDTDDTPVSNDVGAKPDSAPHSSNGPAVAQPKTPSNKVETKPAIPKKCITFTSTNPDWRYHADGVWASAGTGSFGSGSKEVCFDTNNGAGGAMFIGTEHTPIGGNTKLECFFPEKGKGNCDVSLVDGYSLSVECQVGGKHHAGGGTNLFKTGKGCADGSELSRGICKNDKGYAANQNDVTPFFKQGVVDGNDYCIWVNCKQDYFFSMSEDITCHVSGGR